MNNLELVLEQIGLGELRKDAKYTGALDLALEHLRAATYDIKYPTLKARSFIPVDGSVDPGAETYAYHQWDAVGIGEIISNYSNDLSLVDAMAEKFTAPVHSIGKAFQYSIQDLRRAAMSGNQLDQKRASAARRAIELKIDDIAAVGDAKSKLKGFINNENISVLTATTDGTATTWVRSGVNKAAAYVQADMADCVTEIENTTKGVHSPNTIALPVEEFAYIKQAPVDSTNQTSILKNFLANNPSITMIDSWYKLALADAAGTGPRMVVYQKDPEVLELVIPQEFEQFPPQARSLSFVVPCHARCGGVAVYYPLACVYMDGI